MKVGSHSDRCFEVCSASDYYMKVRSDSLVGFLSRTAMRFGSLSFVWVAFVVGACGPADHADAGSTDVAVSCVSPLRIEPSPVRVATGQAMRVRAVGGSGTALFALEGDTQGSVIELGGGLRAGPRAASFTVVARDGLCRMEARAPVEVVGPFDVQPRSTRVMPGGTVRFSVTGALGSVHFSVIARPSGMGTPGQVDSSGVFSAGTIVGSYDLLARDEGSGREVRLEVNVGTGIPLRPRVPVVAVPVGERVRLDWRGGSGVLDAMVSGPSGGRVLTDGEAMYFDATDARPGYADVQVTDRFTTDTATVRVLVGDTVGTTPIARGTQTLLGDMASGDVNGDGYADLIVGHAERSAVGLEAGGVLVYYGTPSGRFNDRPDRVIEGERTRDRFGSTLLVRDLNGDGIDDVVVGAPEEDLGESDRGAVTLYLGSREGLSTTPERVLVGEDINHRFGTAVVAEDLNGDRAPELIVSAPGAVNPVARNCQGGRVYVYRNNPGQRGVFESIPWQIIDLRDSLSDEPEAVIPCSSTPLEAGRSLAVMDMDGDRVLDLVVGAPGVSYPTPSRSHGAVLIHRGRMDGLFEPTPTWSIHLDPSVRTDGARWGFGLDVVRESANGPAVLVVRTPQFTARNAMGASLTSAGGLWVFAPGSLPPPATPIPGDGGMSQPRVRNVTSMAARAFYYGPAANRGVGRSATVVDLDGDGRNEYVVGSAVSGSPGSIQVFSASAMVSDTGVLRPMTELTHMGNELQGFRVTGLRSAMVRGAGLAGWAAWRNTSQGAYTGAVDYVPPDVTAATMRWSMRWSLVLPNFGASDRAGNQVALADLSSDGTMDTVFAAPGAHSPMTMSRPAGDRLRTGAVQVVPAGTTMPAAHLWVDRTDAQIGTSAIAILDFDGDGHLDVAVGDSTESSGGPTPMGFVNPDNCAALNAMGMPTSVSSRGVVRIYSSTAGGLIERFRLWPSRETQRTGSPAWLGNRFGFSLAVADTNGDGLDDLVVGRAGTSDGSGAEVVLGRRYTDAMGRVVIACNKNDAPVFPSSLPTDVSVYGIAVAGVGDLDGDGCDEVAASITRNNSVSGNAARAGVFLSFGYDTTGMRCRGHRTPFTLRIVADDRFLDNNVSGTTAAALASRLDDDTDLPGIPTGMGRTLAIGHGDVTGDGVPDLVFRDVDLAFRSFRGPAVEVLSGAYLSGLCPNRTCPVGRTGPLWVDGDYRVLAVRTLGFPERRIVPSTDSVSQRFGSAIVLADVTGDGASELAIGSPDDSSGASFAGVVRVYRGGAATTTQDALMGDPWLLAVGDITEQSDFGAALAMARTDRAGAWLAVGAPRSSRNGLGGEVGAVYRWRLEVGR